MERLIGIVIPDDIKTKIVKFCMQYNPKLTEPYMTLISPSQLAPVKGVDRKMQSFCLSQPPFKTIIGGPNVEHSDEGSFLYLSVMMGPLNTTRDRLVKHLKISAGSFFRAQLLLLSGKPNDNQHFDEMLQSAKEVFSKAQEFSVKSLAIYSRENEDEFFKIDAEYPFTGR